MSSIREALVLSLLCGTLAGCGGGNDDGDSLDSTDDTPVVDANDAPGDGTDDDLADGTDDTLAGDPADPGADDAPDDGTSADDDAPASLDDDLPVVTDLAGVALVGSLLVDIEPNCGPVGQEATMVVSGSGLDADREFVEINLSGLAEIEADDGIEVVSRADDRIVLRTGTPGIGIVGASAQTASSFDVADVTTIEGEDVLVGYPADTPVPSVLVDRGDGTCAVAGLSSDGSCSVSVVGGSSSGTSDGAPSGSSQAISVDGAAVELVGCRVVGTPSVPLIELGDDGPR